MDRSVRVPVLVLVSTLLGLIVMVAQPSGAHINKKVGHVWKHIRAKADARYLKLGGTATNAQMLDGLDSSAFATLAALVADEGAVNEVENPVHWKQLIGVPAGIADGDDAGQPAWLLAGNGGTTDGTEFLGTTDDRPLNFRVNNERALRLEPGTQPNIIGGFSGNNTTAGVKGAAIGGGGETTRLNSVTDDYGTVGGGRGNRAGDDAGTTIDARDATVGGGRNNTAGPEASTVAGGLGNEANGIASTVGGGVLNDASSDAATVGGGELNTASGTRATIAGGQRNWATLNHATVGGGKWNRADGAFSTVGGGGLTDQNDTSTGNQATDDYGTIGGGGNNRAGDGTASTSNATYTTVSGGLSNTASGERSTIAGGRGNLASGTGAFVGGADTSTASGIVSVVGGGDDNTASGPKSTVAGGDNNNASGQQAFVGGGLLNTAGGLQATVAGGQGNTAGGTVDTVAGGDSNVATSVSGGATVGGGGSNSATGTAATVPGGTQNSAAGDFSLAAGRRAKIDAAHDGSFLFADQTDADFDSAQANEFAVRAGGGVRFVVGGNTCSIDTTTGGWMGSCAPPGGTSGWLLGGNSGTTAGTDFLGTGDDEPLELKVNNIRAFRVEPHGTSPNLVGGFFQNTVTTDVFGATIAGGGAPAGLQNRVTDNLGTVGGGQGNRAGDNAGSTSDREYATVGGGQNNTASGNVATVGGGGTNTASATLSTVSGGGGNTASNGYSTVAGGQQNQATGSQSAVGGGLLNVAGGLQATVGGGQGNAAGGTADTVAGGDSNVATSVSGGATVGGGASNSATGTAATVPGGVDNSAAGDFSLATGRRAKVDGAHDGTFLFADSTASDFNSAAADEFAVRASGGFRFRTSTDLLTGCDLPAGSGAFACTSDRTQKTAFVPVNGEDVLAEVSSLPISAWTFKAENPSIRHIGPTAQDFRTAFGLGRDDLTISMVDADGVALAAIQGLNTVVEEQEETIVALGERVEALESGARRPEAQGANGFLFALIGALSMLVLGMGGMLLRKTRGGGS